MTQSTSIAADERATEPQDGDTVSVVCEACGSSTQATYYSDTEAYSIEPCSHCIKAAAEEGRGANYGEWFSTLLLGSGTVHPALFSTAESADAFRRTYAGKSRTVLCRVLPLEEAADFIPSGALPSKEN